MSTSITLRGSVENAGGERETYQEMEAVLLRQLLSSSGAFKGTESAGSQLRADLFIETLADAVAKSGGLGIASMLEQTLGGGSVEDDDAAWAAAFAEEPAASAPPASGARRSLPGFLAGKLDGEVTSPFGPRTDPLEGGSRYHTGVDVRGAEGAPIVAAASGTVIAAGRRGGYGNAVEVDHGGGVTTLYGHASELLVTAGQKVSEGDQIARVGSTGRATGPHLHFEVRLNDRPIDPTKALNAYRQRAEDTVAGKPRAPGGGQP